MNAKFSFLKRLALGLAAVGIAVAATGTASAASKTWTGGSGNWTSTGTPGWNSSAPATGDTTTFGGTNGKTITVSGLTADLGSMTLSNGVVTNFAGTGPVAFQTGKNINFGNNNVTWAPSIVVGGFAGTGSTQLTLNGSGTVNLNGPVLQGFSATSSQLFVGTGLNLVTATGWSSGAAVVNNGAVTLSGNTGSFTSFDNNGTLKGAGNGTYFDSTFSALNINSGSTITTYIGSTTAYDKWNSTAATTLVGGATLNLNFGSVTGAINGTTWNIFKGDNTDNFGTLNATGTVNGVAVTFTQQAGPGSAWQSQDIGGGTFLVFKNNGDLVVVPEPSTIVFAGVGIAMAGWSAWKKRRLAKA